METRELSYHRDGIQNLESDSSHGEVLDTADNADCASQSSLSMALVHLLALKFQTHF